MRDLGVRIKLAPVVELLKGKDVVVIDDSIVRGTTCRKILHMIKRMGARRVHLRISSAPIRFPCFYGIDTPTKDELVAANLTVGEIKHYMDVDSIGYLSIEGMLDAVKHKGCYCIACFDGSYPIRVEEAQILEGRVR
jgi:amidophosphoribosyltransferase